MRSSTLIVLVAVPALLACSRAMAPSVASTNGLTCRSDEMLVVDNHSGYTIRLVAGEPGGGINAPPNSAILLRELPSGSADTIRSIPGANRALYFNVDRPALPSGSLQRTSGYSGRCVPRT